MSQPKGSWTPEPWAAVIDEPMRRGGTRTFICAPTKQVVLVGEEANVQRATACVNGCAGLNPGAYQQVVELLKRFQHQNWQIKTADIEEAEQALAHAQGGQL